MNESGFQRDNLFVIEKRYFPKFRRNGRYYLDVHSAQIRRQVFIGSWKRNVKSASSRIHDERNPFGNPPFEFFSIGKPRKKAIIRVDDDQIVYFRNIHRSSSEMETSPKHVRSTSSRVSRSFGSFFLSTHFFTNSSQRPAIWSPNDSNSGTRISFATTDSFCFFDIWERVCDVRNSDSWSILWATLTLHRESCIFRMFRFGIFSNFHWLSFMFTTRKILKGWYRWKPFLKTKFRKCRWVRQTALPNKRISASILNGFNALDDEFRQKRNHYRVITNASLRNRILSVPHGWKGWSLNG